MRGPSQPSNSSRAWDSYMNKDCTLDAPSNIKIMYVCHWVMLWDHKLAFWSTWSVTYSHSIHLSISPDIKTQSRRKHGLLFVRPIPLLYYASCNLFLILAIKCKASINRSWIPSFVLAWLPYTSFIPTPNLLPFLEGGFEEEPSPAHRLSRTPGPPCGLLYRCC